MLGTHRKNILLMKRSLFTGFLFLPLGISVHIYSNISEVFRGIRAVANLPP